MKYITIVIFILCLQVASGLLNATGIMPKYMLPHEEWWDSIDAETIEAQQYAKGEVENDIDFGLADFVKSLFIFFYTFGFGIIVVPYTFTVLGIPVEISVLISMPVYLMYFLAFIQLAGNRTTSSMR